MSRQSDEVSYSYIRDEVPLEVTPHGAYGEGVLRGQKVPDDSLTGSAGVRRLARFVQLRVCDLPVAFRDANLVLRGLQTVSSLPTS